MGPVLFGKQRRLPLSAGANAESLDGPANPASMPGRATIG